MRKNIPMIETLTLPGIISDPNLRGGRPIIAGTRLEVADVAARHTFHGYSADDIASAFNLTFAQVHAALAYYFDHKSQIDAQLRAESDEHNQLKEQQHRDGTALLP